jgi:two-component system sensor histidine kinase RstB
LADVRARFDYPVELVALDALAASVRRELSRGADVAYCRYRDGHCVVARLPGTNDVVRLGPFPNYDLREIEEAIGGWMRLAAAKLNACDLDQRPVVLGELRAPFTFAVEVLPRGTLPEWPRTRLDHGEDVAFYPLAEDRWCAVAALTDPTQALCFGPFPSFARIEEKAATTTLTLVLLPVALAIALLLRPVAAQLRHVERAAQTIAAGDLSARVEERRVRSARSLAQSFNHMAGRTEALVRTQRELLQAVSHELRTPLARMRFAIDLIGTARDEDERRGRLAALDNATEELDELVSELLSYVRLETDAQPLAREAVALRELLESLVARYAALHPQIRFDIDERVEAEQVVAAERAGLQRALGNLLANAGRFARSRVAVRVESTPGVTTIDVDDDGEGIPAAERARVFQPFVRLPARAADPGAGLGLAIVQRIVTRHGGTVAALTSPLGGCRIRTTWPARE